MPKFAEAFRKWRMGKTGNKDNSHHKKIHIKNQVHNHAAGSHHAGSESKHDSHKAHSFHNKPIQETAAGATGHEYASSKKENLQEQSKEQKSQQDISGKKEANPKKNEFLFKIPKKKKPERKQRVLSYIEKAGLDFESRRLAKAMFNLAVGITFALSLALAYYFSFSYGISWGALISSIALLWILAFPAMLFGIWVSFYVFLDLRAFKRKQDIEQVLPDFLQLTASNINAGMTIDRALWYAVRPRFGVLANEIETIAKATMSGADLRTELEKFAGRYDSPVLKRSVSMLNEGMEAGGRIGELLNRIAQDIQEQQAMVKEMSANVTTYVIFIGFATIAAAPMLFALSGILVEVVGSLGESMGTSLQAASAAGLPLSFSGASVTRSDFLIFAIVSLSISSFFSALMISTIKKGNSKEGIKYVPVFILVSISLYLIVQSAGFKLVGNFF